MGKQKIRRLEEVDKPFTKEEKKWIAKNLVGTLVTLPIVVGFEVYFFTAIIEKLVY